MSAGRLHVATLLAAVLACVCWAATLANAPAVSAHATLLRADPAAGGSFVDAPAAVTLWFSEAVERDYSRVDVVRADGSRVAAGTLEQIDGPDPALRLSFEGALADGAYTVVWSVFSAVDGHVSEGFFSFTVGDVALPTDAAEAELAHHAAGDETVPIAVDAVTRWANLLGQAVLAGALVFLPFVLFPALRSDGRAAVVPARPFRWLFLVALIVLALGHLAAALVQVAGVTRGDVWDSAGRPLVDLLTGTRYGALWLARALLIVALGLLALSLARGARLLPVRGRGRIFWGAAVGVAGLVLLTTSLGSHAAARGGAWPVVNDWLHLAGSAVWVGGLAALLLSLPLALGSHVPGVSRGMLARFSALALGAGAVLLVTGIVAARAQVVSLEGIVSTRYGTWLTLKLALVAATAGFGAWHLLVVRPSLEHVAPLRASTIAARFRRSLRVETLLAVAVLLAAGILTANVPARELLDPGEELFAATRLTPEASVTLRVSPGRIGANDYSVVVAPRDPATFGTLQRVYLRFTPVEPTTGTTKGGERVLLRQGSDPFTFLGAGAYLALEGDWQVTAIVRRAGEPETEVSFDLTATGEGLRPAGLAPSCDGGVDARVVWLGALWLLGALTLATAGWQARRRQQALSFGLLALSVVALVVGSALVASG